MQELKILEQKLEEERVQIINELKELKENPIVKRFLELNQRNTTLLHQQKGLIREIKLKEFNSCQHLWVITKNDHDYLEGRTERYRGCINCGLNQEVLSKVNSRFGTDFLTFEEEIMYDYLKNGIYMKGSMVPASCDFSLAKAIYLKIKENNPDIDDETACKYFEIALNNIRKTKVNDERKENRAKRLSLSSKFNKWTVCDIEN